jgi:preprotein translocase subunit SecA
VVADAATAAGAGVHVIAASDEQARAGARRLGERAAAIAAASDAAARRAAYAAAVTWATAREFGFDYLRDHLAPSLAAQVQRRPPLALIPDLDALELDTRRAPLVLEDERGPLAQITVRSYLRIYDRVGGLRAAREAEPPSRVLRRLLDYDEVVDHQRAALYRLRDDALAVGGPRRHLESFARRVADDLFASPQGPEQATAIRSFFDLEPPLPSSRAALERAIAEKHARLARAGGARFEEIERRILLRAVDAAWQQHLLALADLQQTVGLRVYARRDPVVEYRREARQLFEALLERVARESLATVFRLVPGRSEQLDELRRRMRPVRPVRLEP